jgi:serine phosphatase RsbU (regulator of sigma subunit)
MTTQLLLNKHLDKVLSETLQVTVLSKEGLILESTNSLQNLSHYYGSSVYDFDYFLESLKDVISSLTPENPKISFPRMEIPFGQREGVFDHLIELQSKPDGEPYFVWTVTDTTRNSEYLALVQQERNDAAIALELQRLKNENELLNELVEARTAEIRQQAELIKIKNQSIVQSIQYASRIQQAFLPTNAVIKSPLFDLFVMSIPRDVVSGDFFWAFQDERFLIFAAIDCTGHGVPGAFLSLVGYTLFDQIVKTDGEREPSAILSKVNQKLFNLLNHNTDQAGIAEGMDAALVCVDKLASVATFAGAKRPLVLFRDNDLVEIKGSPSTIGGRFLKDRIYQSEKIELRPQDLIYLFTDGFPDQFGGEDDKRLGSSNFKRLLQSIETLPFEKQKSALEQSFVKWMGDCRQIDDVTVVGFKWLG